MSRLGRDITTITAVSMTPFWLTYLLHGFAGATDTWDGFRWYCIMGTIIGIIVVTVIGFLDKEANGSDSAVNDNILLYPLGLIAIVAVVAVAYFVSLTAGFIYPELNAGVMAGSKFFGSSEEIRYFLHPVGVLISSFVALIITTWVVLIFS